MRFRPMVGMLVVLALLWLALGAIPGWAQDGEEQERQPGEKPKAEEVLAVGLVTEDLAGPLTPEDLVDAKSYSKLSPRLGVAFPIGERTQFHMNYGKFFQQPNLEDLYVSYRFL